MCGEAESNKVLTNGAGWGSVSDYGLSTTPPKSEEHTSPEGEPLTTHRDFKGRVINSSTKPGYIFWRVILSRTAASSTGHNHCYPIRAIPRTLPPTFPHRREWYSNKVGAARKAPAQTTAADSRKANSAPNGEVWFLRFDPNSAGPFHITAPLHHRRHSSEHQRILGSCG